MLNEIAMGLGALKTAQELLKGLDTAKGQAAITEVRLGLQAQLLEAQGALLAAQEEKAALLQGKRDAEAEVMRLVEWGHERQHYALKRFHPGTVVYEFQPPEGDAQPPHYLCASCYSGSKKGFLQPGANTERAYKMFRCSTCDLVVPVGSPMDV